MDAEDLERPVAREADVAEPRRHVDAEPEPSGGGAPLEHGNVGIRPGVLDGASQVEPARLQEEPVPRDGERLGLVGGLHVEQLVVQGQVVAVGVEPLLVEGVDDDLLPHVPQDLPAGEDHDAALRPPRRRAGKTFPIPFFMKADSSFFLIFSFSLSSFAASRSFYYRI